MRNAEMPCLSQEDVTRFWSKVDRSGGELACWPWQGQTNKDGYGYVRKRMGRLGTCCTRAHRIAFFLEHGFAGEVIMHTCDHPPCCNPSHLRSGTQRDNIDDCLRKGRTRGAVGVLNSNAILDDERVLEIRNRLRAGQRISEIAKDFGVVHETIAAIASGAGWRHLGPPDWDRRKVLPKLDDQKIAAIRRRVAAGEGICALADEYGVTNPVVSRIANGKRNYAHLGPVLRLKIPRRSAAAKLSDDAVREIRRRAAGGESHSSIAKSFGVSRRMIGPVSKRLYYSYVLDGGVRL